MIRVTSNEVIAMSFYQPSLDLSNQRPFLSTVLASINTNIFESGNVGNSGTNFYTINYYQLHKVQEVRLAGSN